MLVVLCKSSPRKRGLRNLIPAQWGVSMQKYPEKRHFSKEIVLKALCTTDCREKEQPRGHLAMILMFKIDL